ncbi:hypothetical protein F66182_2476 [Fusarium sp. NRRL 66182]|nr:hypothetical protein F66182_2476 [Fusarium sp. NRRL 66182]
MRLLTLLASVSVALSLATTPIQHGTDQGAINPLLEHVPRNDIVSKDSGFVKVARSDVQVPGENLVKRLQGIEVPYNVANPQSMLLGGITVSFIMVGKWLRLVLQHTKTSKMHAPKSFFYVALAAGAAAARNIASDNTPLIGPSFISNFDLSDSKYLDDAKSRFPLLVEGLFESGGLNKTDLVFTVDVFSAATNQSIYSYNHVGEPNKETLTKGELSENTIFRTGSVTKMFTVYAIIAQAGTDVLSHPVTFYLPELLGNSSANPIERIDWSDITVGALAAHQAGTGGAVSYFRSHPEDPLGHDRQGFLNYMRDERHPVVTPYRNAVYSDGGYGILTLVLERLTGREYKDAMEEIIFEPLGLNSSSTRVPNGTDVDAVDRTVLGEELSLSWGYDVPVFAGSGSIYSSAKDLRTTGLAILNSELLSPAETLEWMKPRSSTGTLVELVGAPWEITRLTLPVGPDSNRTRVSDLYIKAGGNIDYNCIFALSPDHGIGYSISLSGLTSSWARWTLRDLVGEIFIPAAEHAAAENAAKSLAGTFVVEGSQTTNLTLDVTEGEPGLNLKSFFIEGQDQVANVTSAHLYPTGLYSNSRSLASLYQTKGNFSVAFRQVSGPVIPPPARASAEGGEGGLFDNTFSWLNVGADGALDEFVFDLVDTKVVRITNVGHELQFARTDTMSERNRFT